MPRREATAMGKRLVLVLGAIAAAALAGCRLGCKPCALPGGIVNSRQLSQQGLEALAAGELAQAETLLAQAVDCCPADPDAAAGYAEVLWRQGRHTEALAQLETSLRLAPDDAARRVRSGQMRLEMGQLEAALADAETALALDHCHAGAWALRGRTIAARGDSRAALADLHRSLSYAPDQADVLLALAEVHLVLGEASRAQSSLDALAELSGGDAQLPPYALALAGRSYLAQGRYEDAVERLAAARAAGRADATILALLAQAQLAAGRPGEALTSARDAVALEPSHAEGRAILARVETAHRQALVPLAR